MNLKLKLVLLTNVTATSLLALALAAGCAGSPTAPAKTADTEEVVEDSEADADAEDEDDEADEAVEETSSFKGRKLRVGDYFVHRFTGTFNKRPVVLTEKVIAQEDGAFVVDFQLEEAGKVSSLRVRYDAENPTRLLSVHEVDGDEEKASSLAAFETLLARTVFSPDENLEQLDEEETTCLVGEDELDCKKIRYKVMVGDKEGVLEVISSPAVAGRDIGGEVKTEDGTLLYRAQLVATGNDVEGKALSQR